MFDKIQQGRKLLQMRKQAKEMQRKLQEITHMEDKRGWKIVVDGTQNIISIDQDDGDIDDLKDVINDAMKEVQKKAAKKMMEDGGGLSGLLGGM